MVETRRSRSNNSGDDESVTSSNLVDQREREPLLSSISEQPARRPPPPPPPPPPMPTAVTGNSPRPAMNTQRLTEQAAVIPNPGGGNVDIGHDEPPVQYLQVRATISSYHPSKIYRRHHHPSQQSTDSRKLHRRKQQTSMSNAFPQIGKGEVIRVLIPANEFASEKQLSDCLNHACNADDTGMSTSIQKFSDDVSWDSTEEFYEDKRRNTVAGMFRESDGVFIPLSIIYSQPRAFVNDVLSIKRPTPKETRQYKESPKKSSIFITFLEIFGILSVTIASWLTYSASQSINWDMVTNKMESLFLAMINLPFYLFDVMIEFPLRELYRHGPSLIGWEGESLARICSRVTHYGDEDFWRRNMEECEGIYASKEAAAMQIRKPILIGTIVLILFYMVKSIVEAQAMRRQQLDPNMVETYRAITMLARQLKRAVNNNR